MTDAHHRVGASLVALDPDVRELVMKYEHRIAAEFEEALGNNHEYVVVYVSHPGGLVAHFERAGFADTMMNQWERDLEVPSMIASTPAISADRIGFWVVLRNDLEDEWCSFIIDWPRDVGPSN